MRHLAPTDDAQAREDIAEKSGILSRDIHEILVVDWITGEVLVFFHGGRKSQTAFLEPAVPA